jgi:putative transposase
MSKLPLQEQLLQSNSEQTSEIFNEYLRGAVRFALLDLMQEEVQTLCGQAYDRNGDDCSGYRRAGSEKGVCYIDRGKESIKRPRVRRVLENGDEEEVTLNTYQAARQVGNIREDIAALLLEGVSTRGASRLSKGSVSKSTISEQWAEKAAEKLEEFRSRPLAEEGYLVLMLDGVHLSKDQMAIVALGIREDGSKEMLDFQVGSSESFEVANDLLKSLRKRGLKSVAKRFLVLLDGSQALEKAVHHHYPKAVLQRCLVHKERNLRSYLSKRHHGELARLLKRLRRAEGKEAAQEVYQELYEFLEGKNAAALASLKEAGEQITALQAMSVPATLHRSLLSTNIIENSILNIRRKMRKVNRWRSETKMAERYLAAGLLYAESTFKKISGHKDLPKLIEALNIETSIAI